jgi:hypothetical protein
MRAEITIAAINRA